MSKPEDTSHCVYAFVFARGGSKGVPGKNIRPLAGKPLLTYAIDMARQVGVAKVFVSTDDDAIAEVAHTYGASVILRPAELARDESPEWLAWRHALDWLDKHGETFDVFLSLPATSPMRNVEDVQACLDKLDEETDIVVTMTETARSPWFNMVRSEDNYIQLLLSGEKSYIRRQDVPQAFDMTTVAYVTRPKFIRTAGGIFEGRVKGVLVPNERALDIDTELDFLVAETLMHGKET